MSRIFFISCVGLSECQQAKTRGTLVQGVSQTPRVHHWLRNHLPHMPAHRRQSERQNIIARTHTWQQCSVSTSEAILTTKYGFNLRQNSPLNIENNTGYSGWIRVSVAHALIGPQSLKLAHFWSDIRWFTQFRSFCCLNATVPTSPPGDHSQVESPARGYCAKNGAYVNKAG